MFVLVVHVYLAFAQQPVTITIFKTEVEADLASFNLYQDEGIRPFASVDAATRNAEGNWVWQGDITLTNGKTIVYATALDTTGNESVKSPGTLFDPAPSSPDKVTVVKIEVRVITGE